MNALARLFVPERTRRSKTPKPEIGKITQFGWTEAAPLQAKLAPIIVSDEETTAFRLGQPLGDDTLAPGSDAETCIVGNST